MFPTISNRFIQGRGYGLVLLLVLVVLLPSICVLWFMNRAVKNERLAVRQKLIDVYRGQLSAVQDRLENHLRQSAGDLDALSAQLSPAAFFARQVQTGQADALICFDASGNITYPADASPSKPESFVPGWLEAQQLETTEPMDAADAFAAIARTSTNSDVGARALWQGIGGMPPAEHRGDARCVDDTVIAGISRQYRDGIRVLRVTGEGRHGRA